MAEKKRTSIIRKAITRKINTAKYETIDIVIEQQHEVEWADISELMKKSANVGKLVIDDYKETEASVMEELELSGHKAFGNDPAPKKKIEQDDFDSV